MFACAGGSGLDADETSLDAGTPRELSCHDPDGPDDVAGTWVVGYVERPTADKTETAVDITSLQFVTSSGAVSQLVDSAQWQLSIRRRLEPGYDTLDISSAMLLATQTDSEPYRQLNNYPRLQTPNRHCTMLFRSYDYLPPSHVMPDGARVAIVGDSLTNMLSGNETLRNDLAIRFAADNWQVEVVAQGGMPWMRVPGESVGSDARDEIRGLLATQPAVMVFALGINDALNIAVTAVYGVVMDPEAARRLYVSEIDNVLAEVQEQAPQLCKVLVTPGLRPFVLVGDTLSVQSAFVGDVLRFFAGVSTVNDISMYTAGYAPYPNTHIADWATVSADKDKDAWFADGIHFANTEGTQAYLDILMEGVAGCLE